MTDIAPPAQQQDEQNGPAPSRLSGVGYFVLFLFAAAFFSIGATTLRAMDADVQKAKLQAAEDQRPANISIIKLLASDCTACYDVSKLADAAAQDKKVNITNVKTVKTASLEGTALIQQYNLQRAPAIIVQGDVEKLLKILPQLQSYGQVQDDDFVGRALPAPFKEIQSGKIRGEMDVTYITEKQCKECYDPTINRQILARFGMVPKSEKTVDRLDAEGERLVKHYAITTTPTVLLTGDLKAYTDFDAVWKQVGTIEPDGTYIFRTGQAQMGTYYDLVAKKVVAAKKNDTSTNSSQ